MAEYSERPALPRRTRCEYLQFVRVLIADGDRRIISSLKRGLGDAGYVVDVALNSEHVLWHVTEFDYDAVLLDGTLPGLDAMQIAVRLRDRNPWTPILALVDLGDGSEAGRGMDAIADAHVVKPIAVTAVISQLGEVLRAAAQTRPPDLRVGDLRMKPATRQAWRGEVELSLSPREFTLLQVFLTYPGEVLTRQRILGLVWGSDYDKASNLVDQYVLYLRRKVDHPFAVRQIETVRKVGYRLLDST